MRLPPLTALRHFDAAARHLSFKKAAEELAVSPAAVTHQIKLLEEFLGKPLFIRETRRILLTEAGERLARTVSHSFRELADVARQIAAAPDADFVTVKLGRYIGARWLSPRLRDFWSSYPAVDLRLHHSVDELPDDPPDIDLAILWGNGIWPGLVVEPLISIQSIPLCAPALLAAASSFLAAPTTGARLLLHYRDHASWREWFQSAGLDPDLAGAGQVFDDANVVIEAAIAGQGIALGYLPISRVELKDGRLTTPHPHRCEAAFRYYLVYRANRPLRPPVALFRDWLLKQADQLRAEAVT